MYALDSALSHKPCRIYGEILINNSNNLVKYLSKPTRLSVIFKTQMKIFLIKSEISVPPLTVYATTFKSRNDNTT